MRPSGWRTSVRATGARSATENVGASVPAALEAVEHHLSLCSECREEYEALRLALDGLKPDDESS